MPRSLTLRRAARIVGDCHVLRGMLKVPMHELYQWLAGNARPPAHVFLQAVDIIEAHAQVRDAPARCTPSATEGRERQSQSEKA